MSLENYARPVAYGDDEQGGDISDAMIAACESIATLAEWLGAFECTEDNIKAQIEARKFAGTDEEDWIVPAGQALGWALTGKKRVKRRMEALGVDFGDRNAGRLGTLQSMVRGFKAKAARWLLDGNFVEIAKDRLEPVIFADIMHLAASRTAKLTEVIDLEEAA